MRTRTNGYFTDRDETEVQPLANDLFESLRWFFSSENAEINRAALGPTGNRVAFINAYLDMCEYKYMILESPTNYKRGCSFWGCLYRENWLSMSKGSALNWCTKKAKEILHV